MERWISLKFSWAGKTFELEIAESDRVYDLKAALHSLTEVPPERQKILGLVKGKLPPDQGRMLVTRVLLRGVHCIAWINFDTDAAR